MADISKEELQKEIEKILSKANLATTSAKNVRQQLEKSLGVDLIKQKQLINDLVMEYIENKESEDEDEQEVSSEEEEKEKKPAKPVKKRKQSTEEESDDDDDASNDSDSDKKKKTAAKKKRGAKKDEDSDDWGKKNKKPAKGKKGGGGRGKGGGYTRAYKLAPALSELMGAAEMPRHEVVRRVWAIIKEKNLYDPSNKQFAICDDAFYKVFQTKRFRIFGMMKYLKTHFLDD